LLHSSIKPSGIVFIGAGQIRLLRFKTANLQHIGMRVLQEGRFGLTHRESLDFVGAKTARSFASSPRSRRAASREDDVRHRMHVFLGDPGEPRGGRAMPACSIAKGSGARGEQNRGSSNGSSFCGLGLDDGPPAVPSRLLLHVILVSPQRRPTARRRNAQAGEKKPRNSIAARSPGGIGPRRGLHAFAYSALKCGETRRGRASLLVV